MTIRTFTGSYEGAVFTDGTVAACYGAGQVCAWPSWEAFRADTAGGEFPLFFVFGDGLPVPGEEAAQ